MYVVVCFSLLVYQLLLLRMGLLEKICSNPHEKKLDFMDQSR